MSEAYAVVIEAENVEAVSSAIWRLEKLEPGIHVAYFLTDHDQALYFAKENEGQCSVHGDYEGRGRPEAMLIFRCPECKADELEEQGK